MERFLLRNTDNPNSADIEEYIRSGGYKNISKAFELQPSDIIEEVKKSGLRGRGGAGFPTFMKWNFASADKKFPKYLICNADEGEPGTFKDRPILEKNPHLLIEGMIISAHALKSEHGYIYLRGEYPYAYEVLRKAIGDAYSKGYLGGNILGKNIKFHLSVHQGAGAYICGEETALLDSLEGRRGQPRSKPPFPVNEGAWGMPTIVNNVETLANVPYIIEIGADAYSKIGNPNSPGPKLYCISGHVNKPGVYELPMGTSLREIIYDHAGGIRDGKKLKSVFPGGISTPLLPGDCIDCEMDFVSMPKYGSMLGAGAVIVMDESVCMVKVAHRAMKFFEHESCGKCTPCREGTEWMRKILERVERGWGRKEDISLLADIANNISGKSFCALGDGAACVMNSMLKHFKAEFEDHVKEKKCRLSRGN
jgi:NADH-quinone oxidoreductase subunit F